MIHIAYITPTQVFNGIPADKEDLTIKQAMHSDMEMRILPNEDNPNTIDRPTIEEYLTREDDDGLEVKAITNTMIVTQS